MAPISSPVRPRAGATPIRGRTLSRAAAIGVAALVGLGCAAERAAAQSAAIPLWSHAAPGTAVTPAPEVVRLTPEGEHIVTGVRTPSITPYLPDPAKAVGLAVIIVPGGGYRELWMDHEGYRVAQWLSDRGVAAFVLKYRLPAEAGSPYRSEVESLADVQRAIRLVRSRAAEWRIDPARVGVIGFSAGGNLAALAGWRETAVLTDPADPVDQQTSKPAFEALIYPDIPAHGAFSAATPATFLLAGDKDRPQVSEGLADLYLQIHRAGGSAELHLLAGVAHGFGMRDRNSAAIRAWPSLFWNWLEAQGLLKPAP